MTQTTEQILALAEKYRAPQGHIQMSATQFVEEVRAAIESYKAELLKEVGEPVAARRKVAMWQGGDDYKYEWAVVKEHTPGTEPLYTSDQVAAAVAKATKPLEERICDLTACKWPEAYTVIPVKINGQLHATSQAISEEMESARQQLAKAEQRIAELEGDVAIEHAGRKYWEDAYSELLNTDKAAQGLIAKDERIAELEADLAAARQIIDEENKDHIEQLAASQLRETQLRELIKRAHEFVRDGLCNDGLSSLMEALALPTDTSALDAYVSEKVKEAMK